MKRHRALQRLSHFPEDSEEWAEFLVKVHRTTSAEIAITRIDFRTWLAQFPARLRGVAEVLASGETTIAALQPSGVSMGWFSQLSSGIENAWLAFQVELPGAAFDAA